MSLSAEMQQMRLDKASRVLIDKNSSNKLISKNTLKIKSRQSNKSFSSNIDKALDENARGDYLAGQSVIDENISDYNLLQQSDDELHRSIKKGQGQYTQDVEHHSPSHK
tara:strand:+ start:807 stop:1133 length:327 start_codon:yes stop_codon:yes gene_type:complete